MQRCETYSTQRRILLGLVTLAVIPQLGVSQTELALRKISPTEVAVLLSNDEPVAAIQLTVNSSGPVLLSVKPGNRVEETGWILSSNTVDESTINVVLLRSGNENLSSGTGSVAFVTIAEGSSGTISLSRVVIASPAAQRIEAQVFDLEWSETPAVLGQNYPNPFNPVTTIPFTLEQESSVKLVVYDITGREIKRVVEGHRPAGASTASWDGADENGSQVPSGVYFVKLEAGTTTQTIKMILAR
jgi:hypothetical protein